MWRRGFRVADVRVVVNVLGVWVTVAEVFVSADKVVEFVLCGGSRHDEREKRSGTRRWDARLI